jgi:hypothetical protein
MRDGQQHGSSMGSHHHPSIMRTGSSSSMMASGTAAAWVSSSPIMRTGSSSSHHHSSYHKQQPRSRRPQPTPRPQGAGSALPSPAPWAKPVRPFVHVLVAIGSACAVESKTNRISYERYVHPSMYISQIHPYINNRSYTINAGIHHLLLLLHHKNLTTYSGDCA